MALADLWKDSPDQLRDKQVGQVIAFAGAGKLRDGGDASREFRAFLRVIPSTYLSRYAEECLATKFEESGLALQDVVNELGRRLGFDVNDGYYRGSPGRVGHDGLWHGEDGKSVVVEVKTTDAYRISLDVLGGYRSALIKDGTLHAEASSILIVVGREDTGELEAQIRGSKYAWEARLISVDKLVQLMRLKENLEEPHVARKIRDILTPQEFTRVDAIIDIVFATAEDFRQVDEPSEDEDDSSDEEERRPKFVPAAFHQACIERIEKRLGKPLIKRSRATYATTEGSLAVLCSVSRLHSNETSAWYWFAFHPHQRETLSLAPESYVALGCGSEEAILLIPLAAFESWLEGMNTTQKPDRYYWHVVIYSEGGRYVLRLKRGFDRVDVTEYLLPSN